MILKRFTETFFQVKESIIEMVGQVEVDNLQTLTQVTSVIASATEDAKDLSAQAQVWS